MNFVEHGAYSNKPPCAAATQQSAMPGRKGSEKEGERWRITEMSAISDADLRASQRSPMKWALLAIVLLSLSNVGLAVAAGIAPWQAASLCPMAPCLHTPQAHAQ